MLSKFRFLGLDSEDTLAEKTKNWIKTNKSPLVNYQCWASSRLDHVYFRIGHCNYKKRWYRCPYQIPYIGSYPCHSSFTPHKQV